MYVSYGNLLMYPRFFKENGRSPSLPGGGGRIPQRVRKDLAVMA